MKIGVFTDSYRPYTSGVVRSIDTFRKELINKGHDVYIFSPNYPNCQKEEKVFRFASLPAPTKKDFSLAIPLSLSISSTIKKIKLDIIHVHSPFLMGNLGRRVARKHGLPLVFTFHTMYDQYAHYVPFLHNTSKGIVKNLGVDFCNSCDLVITPTLVVKQHLLKNGVKKTITNIPTGLVVSEFENVDKKWLKNNYNLPADNLILLYVGRLGKEKNVDFLIKCFHNNLKYFKNQSLVLVGDGPEKNSLQGLVNKLDISSNVFFTGLLDREKVIKAYAGSDIFIFASLTETQGIVLLEAKAAGVPTVAVSAFGVKEMISHGEDGFLSPHDEINFTKYLLTLTKNNKLRYNMSRKTKENIKYFTSEYTTDRLINEYQKLRYQKILV